MLNDKNRELILVLQKDPLANFNQLAETLGSTPPTIKRRMESLQSGQDPVIISIHGSINHTSLGLEMDTYFIDLKPGISKKKFQQLFNLFDYHPYTSFQNRCFGAVNGMLVQLYKPIGSTNEYSEIFDRLSSVQLTRLHHIPQVDYGIESFPVINYWKDGKWDFSFYDWFESESVKLENSDTHSKPTNYLHEIELPHIIMLRELSNDGRKKQVDIMNQIQTSPDYNSTEKEFFSKDRQREVSRYYEFINQKNLISNYYLLYNRETFGIFNQVCFIGRMDKSNLAHLSGLISSTENPLPFRSRLGIAKDKFFWWLNLPPHQSMEVMNFVFEISDELDTIMLDSSVKHSRTYPLWHRNFNEAEKTWKQDHNWMIDNPLVNNFSL